MSENETTMPDAQDTRAVIDEALQHQRIADDLLPKPLRAKLDKVLQIRARKQALADQVARLAIEVVGKRNRLEQAVVDDAEGDVRALRRELAEAEQDLEITRGLESRLPVVERAAYGEYRAAAAGAMHEALVVIADRVRAIVAGYRQKPVYEWGRDVDEIRLLNRLAFRWLEIGGAGRFATPVTVKGHAPVYNCLPMDDKAEMITPASWAAYVIRNGRFHELLFGKNGRR